MMTRRLAPLCLVLVSATSCSHAPRQSPQAAPKAEQATPLDASQLSLTDVRLLTEALAYDVSHGSWLQAYATAHEGDPTVFVGDVPDVVAPSATSFPKASFTDSLVQSLRNSHRLLVANSDQGNTSPTWRLDIAATHDTLTVEGQDTRGYRIEATLKLCPSHTVAWRKTYELRKRLQPVSGHDHGS